MRIRVGFATAVVMMCLAAPQASIGQECPEQLAGVEFALQQTLRDIPNAALLNALPAAEKAAASEAKALVDEARRLLAQARAYRCLEPDARDHERAIAMALTRAAYAFLEGADNILAEFGMMTHRY